MEKAARNLEKLRTLGLPEKIEQRMHDEVMNRLEPKTHESFLMYLENTAKHNPPEGHWHALIDFLEDNHEDALHGLVQSAIPAILENRPDEKRLRTILQNTKRIASMLPERQQTHLLGMYLSRLLKKNPSEETWKVIFDELPEIPDAGKASFVDISLPYALAHKPTPEELRKKIEVVKAIAEKMPEKCEGLDSNLHDGFLRYWISSDLRRNLTPEQMTEKWRKITKKVIPEMTGKGNSPNNRRTFYTYTLSRIVSGCGKNKKMLALIADEIIPSLSFESRHDLLYETLPEMLAHKPPVGKVRKNVRTATRYLERMPKDEVARAIFLRYTLREMFRNNPGTGELKKNIESLLSVVPHLKGETLYEFLRVYAPKILGNKPTPGQFGKTMRIIKEKLESGTDELTLMRKVHKYFHHMPNRKVLRMPKKG